MSIFQNSRVEIKVLDSRSQPRLQVVSDCPKLVWAWPVIIDIYFLSNCIWDKAASKHELNTQYHKFHFHLHFHFHPGI
jgi:hypothetical protein